MLSYFLSCSNLSIKHYFSVFDSPEVNQRVCVILVHFDLHVDLENFHICFYLKDPKQLMHVLVLVCLRASWCFWIEDKGILHSPLSGKRLGCCCCLEVCIMKGRNVRNFH